MFHTSTPHARRTFIARFGLAVGIAGFAPLSAIHAASGDTTYKIRSGDSLGKIAERFGVSISALRRANGLRGDRIIAGKALVIPGAEAPVLGDFRRETRKLSIGKDRWKFVVLHHSATTRGNAEIYGRYHRRKGMRNGLAYHFVIGNGIDSGDGEIEIGNRWLRQLHGGHVKSSVFNRFGIGICLVGNFMHSTPSQKQIASLYQLVDFLGRDVMGNDFTVTAHRLVDQNHTVCPGDKFPLEAVQQRYA